MGTKPINEETSEIFSPFQIYPSTFTRERVFPSVPPEAAGDNDISWAKFFMTREMVSIVILDGELLTEQPKVVLYRSEPMLCSDFEQKSLM